MAGKVTVREPTFEDALHLAANLREADLREVEAFRGPLSEAGLVQALWGSVEASYRVSAAERYGKPIAFFGTTPLSVLTGKGCLWMLGTAEINKVPGVLTRLARQHIAEVGGVFPHLSNLVDVRNTASLKWLQWLGATIHEAEPAGLYGWPFHRFEIGVANVH